jgi:Bacterial fructose-1,6-bisphosphatase, glpX-encoded
MLLVASAASQLQLPMGGAEHVFSQVFHASSHSDDPRHHSPAKHPPQNPGHPLPCPKRVPGSSSSETETFQLGSALRGTGVHAVMGIGGAPEEVLKGGSLRCLNGEIQARLVRKDDKPNGCGRQGP